MTCDPTKAVCRKCGVEQGPALLSALLLGRGVDGNSDPTACPNGGTHYFEDPEEPDDVTPEDEDTDAL